VLCEPAIRVAGLIAREQVDQIERLIDQDRVDEALNLGTQRLAAAALERSDGRWESPAPSPFRRLFAAVIRPKERDRAATRMAKPGLEPGTPRFSVAE
jgi:hypothetical protein